MAALTAEQFRFLSLHARHVIARSKWLFQGMQLRAFAERGHTATISADGLADLIASGLMQAGRGEANIAITDAGRAALIVPEIIA